MRPQARQEVGAPHGEGPEAREVRGRHLAVDEHEPVASRRSTSRTKPTFEASLRRWNMDSPWKTRPTATP